MYHLSEIFVHRPQTQKQVVLVLMRLTSRLKGSQAGLKIFHKPRGLSGNIVEALTSTMPYTSCLDVRL